MTSQDILRLRLSNQRLTAPTQDDAVALVRWMGAVQAQDYAGAKWALGCRLKGVSDVALDEMIDNGDILRTHVLRPTWHFVLPEDIRWMMTLTEPRITAFGAKYFRDLELDKKLLNRSNRIITKALEGGDHLTKKEIGALLEKNKIATNDLRLTFIIIRAELDQLVCNGARRGKQFTYALLEARAPKAVQLKKDEALTALAQRYFLSRGPATLKDFTWWSGLSPVDARAAVESVKSQFDQETVGGQLYLYASSAIKPASVSGAHLLPAWDEYTVAYKDRSLVIDPEFSAKAGNGIFNFNIVWKGQIIGAWKRTVKGDKVIVDLNYFRTPSPAVAKKVSSVTNHYAKFLNKKAQP
jgi:hypothetical protein